MVNRQSGSLSLERKKYTSRKTLIPVGFTVEFRAALGRNWQSDYEDERSRKYCRNPSCVLSKASVSHGISSSEKSPTSRLSSSWQS